MEMSGGWATASEVAALYRVNVRDVVRATKRGGVMRRRCRQQNRMLYWTDEALKRAIDTYSNREGTGWPFNDMRNQALNDLLAVLRRGRSEAVRMQS